MNVTGFNLNLNGCIEWSFVIGFRRGMRQRVPILRDEKRQASSEHHIAYHEAFLSRLDNIRLPHENPERVQRRPLGDDHLFSVLRRMRPDLHEDCAPSSSSSSEGDGDECHQEMLVDSMADNTEVTTACRTSRTSTSMCRDDGSQQLMSHCSLPVTHAPRRVPLTHLYEAEMAIRQEWYRNYVGWAMYYRACAEYHAAQHSET